MNIFQTTRNDNEVLDDVISMTLLRKKSLLLIESNPSLTKKCETLAESSCFTIMESFDCVVISKLVVLIKLILTIHKRLILKYLFFK